MCVVVYAIKVANENFRAVSHSRELFARTIRANIRVVVLA